jgi:hypothetical protein
VRQVKWSESTWPAAPALRSLVERAERAVAELSPTALALVGAEARLPEASLPRQLELVEELRRVGSELAALPAAGVPADEVDRVVLLHTLHRATAGPRLGEPAGPEVLEQHLQLALRRLLGQPAGVTALASLVEAAPGFLARSRPTAGTGSVAAGRVAVEAAGRLPALLDACAGAAGALATTPVRSRIEAALGALLQAGAEESGWLLKVYIPAAAADPKAPPDPLASGLGLSLEALESAAEAALTQAVLAPAPDPGAAVTTSLDDPASAARAWARAARGAEHLGGAGGEEVEVVAAPGWLEQLLPGLSLVLPGPLDEGPAMLLVSARGHPTVSELELVYRADFLPWAWSRPGPRVARLLLGAPDLGEGWRAHLRGSDPGLGGGLPWPRELAWRAALVLAAIGMTTRGVTVEAAAGLVAAESGVGQATALQQCFHLARRPLGALTFLAGRLAVGTALARVGTPRLLSAGPLPAAAMALLD